MSTPASDPDTQTTLSIPSLLIFAALLALLIRWFFFAPPASASATSTSSTSATHGGRPARVPPERIDTVAAMFPQLPRRDIEWDLRRNGGSVQATTERVLRSGVLDAAPPSFRAQTPPPLVAAAQQQPAAGAAAAAAARHVDLIARYGLQARVAEGAGGAAAAATGEEKEKEKEKAWSSSKAERAALLRRRREEMVLEARRKLVEREKGKARA